MQKTVPLKYHKILEVSNLEHHSLLCCIAYRDSPITAFVASAEYLMPLGSRALMTKTSNSLHSRLPELEKRVSHLVLVNCTLVLRERRMILQITKLQLMPMLSFLPTAFKPQNGFIPWKFMAVMAKVYTKFMRKGGGLRCTWGLPWMASRISLSFLVQM